MAVTLYSLFLPSSLQILAIQKTVPYLQLFSLSYAGTVNVSLTLASSFRILCYDDRRQYPRYAKDSGIITISTATEKKIKAGRIE
jgi:hypothetical protein